MSPEEIAAITEVCSNIYTRSDTIGISMLMLIVFAGGVGAGWTLK